MKNDMQAGAIHSTNSCGDIKIIACHNSRTVEVVFAETGFAVITTAGQIRNGQVKDLLKPNLHGVGCFGAGDYKATVGGKNTPQYNVWRNMLDRCYDSKFQETNTTYIGCSADPDWHNFQVFAAFYDANYPTDGSKYALDKDLIEVDNKVYSPKTCVFLPNWLNTFTTDSRASRGKYLIGVSWSNRDGKFESRCSVGGKTKHLGKFDTELEAHLTWKWYKLDLALKSKPKMDLIDARIYPNVIQIINGAR